MNKFYLDLGISSIPNLTMEPYNIGDPYLYFNVYNISEFVLAPGSKVRAIIIPSGITTIPNPDETKNTSVIINRLRSNNTLSNDTYGVYSVTGGENNSDTEQYLSFNPVCLYSGFENYPYELHWLYIRGSNEIYGSISGIYSYPHNIQNSEIIVSGLLNSDNTMLYNIKWNTINNDNSVLYGVYPNDGPYKVKVQYANDENFSVSGFNNWIYFWSGAVSSGISFNLPFNDERTGYPANYNFLINNVSAGATKPGSIDKIININHNDFKNNQYFKSIDDIISINIDSKKLKKVSEVIIDSDVINRKRVSIGINDISIKTKYYSKQGYWVSPFYPLDDVIYTFSLNVDEFIPEYNNGTKTDIIKYYVDFNSILYRISPISRSTEFENNKIIPKVYVFDDGNNNNDVYYIKNNTTRGFKIKIVFDVNFISDNLFIAPEVYDFRAIIYNKNSLINI